MKTLSILFLCLFFELQAKEADFHIHSFNPYINSKEIHQIDPSIKIEKAATGLSLRDIDLALNKADLIEILNQYDNVERYILGQRILNQKMSQIYTQYPEIDKKRLLLFHHLLRH